MKTANMDEALWSEIAGAAEAFADALRTQGVPVVGIAPVIPKPGEIEDLLSKDPSRSTWMARAGGACWITIGEDDAKRLAGPPKDAADPAEQRLAVKLAPAVAAFLKGLGQTGAQLEPPFQTKIRAKDLLRLVPPASNRATLCRLLKLEIQDSSIGIRIWLAPPTSSSAPSRADWRPLGEGSKPPADDAGLGLVMDIPVQVRVELGRARMPIREITSLREGSVVQLNRSAGDPVDLFVSDRLVAQGEVVVVEDFLGIRITKIHRGPA